MNRKHVYLYGIALLSLISILFLGCPTKEDTPESASSAEKQHAQQVQTVSRLGEYTILNFSHDNSYTVNIVQNPDFINLTTPSDCWEEDSFRLFLNDEDGQTVLDYSFCSSYGKFEIDFIDLSGDGRTEIVFILGEGRGTSARKEHLFVYEVLGNELHQIYAKEYSDYFGSGVRWWYDHYYRDTNNDGTVDLELILSHDPIGKTHLESPEMIPKEKVKIFQKEM